MSSYAFSILNSQRPGSSARVCENDNWEFDNYEKQSKIPKMPSRTYSLEGKENSFDGRASKTRHQASTTSMIPRPEWKKHSRIPSMPDNGKDDTERKRDRSKEIKTARSIMDTGAELHINKNRITNSVAQTKNNSLEFKINEDVTVFKNNVLKIPEFWTDAGQTVSNILKNAANIVTKQYPSADIENFEQEIHNILKAQEVMKKQILSKTENILNQASKMYVDHVDFGNAENDESTSQPKKKEELKLEENFERNVLDEFVRSIEAKEIGHEKPSNVKKSPKETPKQGKKNHQESDKKDEITGNPKKQRSKSKFETPSFDHKKRDFRKNIVQSCGDTLKQENKLAGKSDEQKPKTHDKSSQTSKGWTNELIKKEEALAILNNEILELQKICRDHITKFKSFNLQIKLRGMCNKIQSASTLKEIDVLNEEKRELVEKNNMLNILNKDLESALKQREMDLQQKDRLINQQKKLLLVRDELIEMLKSRCNIEVESYT